MSGIFIAGTDTGVGKTRMACALVRALVSEGLRVAVMKPVAAGAEATPEGLRNEDALALMAAANVSASYEIVNPYCAPLPASPHIAAREARIVIDPAVIRSRYDELVERADIVVVESAGGWFAPISDTETMADVARALALPVVLVVGLRLGCLNHALLTHRALQANGLELGGWIANHLQPHFERAAENIATLQRHLRAPPLDEVAYDAPAFASQRARQAVKEALSL